MAYWRASGPWALAAVIAGGCATGNVTERDVDDDNSSAGGTGNNSGSGGINGLCGNGQIDVGESCDGDCPASCDDGNDCTADVLFGATHTCDVKCDNMPIGDCEDVADGCCPTSCSGATDADCATCGNAIVELGEECDGNCPAGCDDGQFCTTDSQMGSASSCDLVCGHTTITTCVAGDTCCPAGCNESTDADCGGNNLIVVYADDNVTNAADVISKLTSTGVFPMVTGFDARTVTPTLAQLQMHDVALVWSNYTFADPVLIGNNLADFYDGGGRVVTATFATCTSWQIGGRFGDVTQGYMFLTGGTNIGQVDSLGTVNEPASPLMTGVTTFSAQYALRCTSNVVNGGVVVAQWGNGQPLIVRGVAGGRNRAEVNFFPPSSTVDPSYWTGDGINILRNALIYQ